MRDSNRIDTGSAACLLGKTWGYDAAGLYDDSGKWLYLDPKPR